MACVIFIAFANTTNIATQKISKHILAFIKQFRFLSLNDFKSNFKK